MGIFFLKQLARMPFWLIYQLSGLAYLLVYYVARYRKNVVYGNLRNAFPEKSEEEIRLIAKRFYRHFSELTLEIIKLANMDEADFNKRVVVKNTGLLDDYFNRKISLVALTMHYNNWEWSSCLALYLKHKSLGVYKPLHNKKYDEYLNQNRARMGAEMIPNHQVLRRVIKAREQDETFFLWLAGDQTPPLYHKFWLKFLNQDALFYPGPAAISRRYNYPVIFQKTIKKGRGKYEASFEVLFENPENYSEAEIMKKYIIKMEETIREQPEYYLWSHKRWKHKRPEGVPLKE
jgi:Kdo2-lipid IVA lauroyltransferase/acyltransferase